MFRYATAGCKTWTGHVHGKHGLSTHFVILKRGLKTCKHFITSNIFEFAVPSEANCYGGGGGLKIARPKTLYRNCLSHKNSNNQVCYSMKTNPE